MMKIIISGSNGFVGKSIMNYLQNGVNTLTGISRYPNAENEIDWNDFFSNTPGFDVFIHLAGKAHDLKNTSNPESYFEVNTELTKKVYDVFLKSKASTFIYFSSVKAVADAVDGILEENVFSNPQTPYGQSKQQAEAYILSIPVPSNKRIFILRPCMIHGPGNKGNLNLLYKFVRKGIPYPLAAFDNRRSLLSIDNLNYIIEKLITNPSIPGGVYNMADDEPLSTNSIINLISENSRSKPKLWKISPGVIKTIAAIGDRLYLPLNSERLKKLTENYIVSNKKIKAALNINHLPVSSINGLKATIQSFNEI